MIPVVKQLNPPPCMTYLVYSAKARRALLVDPLLGRTDEYLSLLEQKEIRLAAVLDTHSHDDHGSGCGELAAGTRGSPAVTWYVHPSFPASPSASPAARAPRAGRDAPGHTTVLVEGRIEIVPGIQVEIIFTPGHTRDSLCVVLDGAILTGDTLWLDDSCAGLVDGPDGQDGDGPAAHLESIARLKRLQGGHLILPGHEHGGARPSTLETQLARNPLMRVETVDAYRELGRSRSAGDGK
jgi:glyoxylase-like metal-dependent hydrolase (beta-lactamase superfamily II)